MELDTVCVEVVEAINRGEKSISEWDGGRRNHDLIRSLRLFEIKDFVFKYHNKIYSISFRPATSGMGGMDMGSPDTWNFKDVDLFEVDENKVVQDTIDRIGNMCRRNDMYVYK